LGATSPASIATTIGVGIFMSSGDVAKAAALPCGSQLVGAPHQTDALLQVALACEAHLTR